MARRPTADQSAKGTEPARKPDTGQAVEVQETRCFPCEPERRNNWNDPHGLMFPGRDQTLGAPKVTETAASITH